MGQFSEIFVRRPVLAVVISLVILLLGMASVRLLDVREYPESSSTVIAISTPYPGASADLVRGFITAPLEQVIASASGIDYLTSSSTQNVSTIQAHLELNYDENDALAQILTKVNQVRNVLPEGSEDPVVVVTRGDNTTYMYIAITSEVLTPSQINDYLVRSIRPQLESVPGVQQAQILGAVAVAMRVWLDPQRMAALNVTPTDVRTALAANNYLAAVGETDGPSLSINLSAATDLRTVEEFSRLVVREDGATLIRLADVADVALGAESYNSSVFFQGTPAVFIGIEVAPTANPLDVISEVRAILPELKGQLPSGITLVVAYDGTVFIERSIDEVLSSLMQSLVIVTIVIYLFLGSVRSALVPAVAMPLALVGGLFLMLVMGFSINLLTLLALILAVGTVVDDGIVVAENVSRHVEAGTSPMDAALMSARELASSIVAMNIVVLAVYLPVGFLTGVTGNLFTEFAYTVAAATLISGVVALTLSPMMCAYLIKPEHTQNRLSRWVDAGFQRVAHGYRALLSRALNGRWLVLAMGGGVLLACVFLYMSAEREVAPDEDQGFLGMSATADPSISLTQLEHWTSQIGTILTGFDAIRYSFVINGARGGRGLNNSAFAGASLKPWEERDVSAMELQPQLQRALAGIPGLQVQVYTPSPLPGTGGGPPIQFVISANEEGSTLYEVAEQVLAQARRSGKFAFLESDLKYDRLVATVEIDRAKAADLGIDMRQLGADLATTLSEGYVNFFSTDGRSYRVIPQVERSARLTPEQLTQYHIRTGSGQLVPLSTVVQVRESVQPRELARFDQLNSATLSGTPAPGVTLGEAVSTLQQIADQALPDQFLINWEGESRQYIEEGSALVLAFGLAVILMYLVLAAQFESFRDPAIMLVSVPMSLAGALIFFTIGILTVNIYTQIGLLGLIASIIRHGILLVEFANQVQLTEHLDRHQAMEKAAARRLRPILMTTIATLAGMIPLLIATGPGSESRFAIGLVLGAGMAIGTVFTLFVVPALYVVVARDRHQAST